MGLIPQRDYFDKDIANSDNTSGYYIIEHNDFVYNPRKSSDAPYGPISRYAYPDAGIVSPLYLCFRAKGDVDTNFFEWYFRSSAWHRYIYMTGDSGARHDRVSIKDDDFFSMPIRFPSVIEQKKIAAFLNSIEQRITSQQLLVDALKKYKRGLLQDMFPQKGATVPKLRLAGFTGAWEQRKLGEILKTLPFKVYLKSPERGGKFEIIQQGNDPIIGFANGEPCNNFRDIVIFGDHTLSLYKPKRPFFVATDGVRILQGVNEMDGNYLLSLLEKNKPISEGYKRYYSILADREVFFTNNRDEQKQIGSLFENLDNFITFHQSKLVLLRKQKNGLLQQLFI